MPRVLFDFVKINFFHGCKTTGDVAEFAKNMSSAVKESFFAIKVIGVISFHDQFFVPIGSDRPFAAVGIVTGIPCCAAAARIVGNHVIDKILVTGICKLMRLARLAQKRVPRSHFGHSVFVAYIAAAGDDKIKFRFRCMRVIGTE